MRTPSTKGNEMKKFKMKPETKQKLKDVWIDASPYVTPVVVFLGGLLYVYSKGQHEANEHYAASLANRNESYASMADRTASAAESAYHKLEQSIPSPE
jgi:hypothetical protein